jgi:Protein of unknown function (DUF1207)
MTYQEFKPNSLFNGKIRNKEKFLFLSEFISTLVMKHLIHHFFSFVVLGLSSINIYAQADSTQADTTQVSKQFFHQRDFGRYFIADVYAPQPQVQVGWGLNLKEYNLSPNRSNVYVPYNETNFGAEIPIYNRIKSINGKVHSKFSISTPICATLWFDFTEQLTAPVLNTDYRFAPLEFNYLRRVNRRLIRNYSLKFIPFFHESSHIGDEITLYRKLDSFHVTRVNISYELAELALTINDPENSIKNNHSFKMGVRALLNPSKGWYSIRSVEGDTTLILPTKHWLESYFQYQWQRSSGFLASKKAVFVFSMELRNRVKFGYPIYLEKIGSNWENIANDEYNTLCSNYYLGWKFNLTPQAEQMPRFGAYLRAYAGSNPYGQFRNIPFYQFVGLAFFYEN